MLRFARDAIINNEELLEKVSEIYADVGYPVKMEDFILYMPHKAGYELLKYSLEENNFHMITLIDEFLEEEKKGIISLTS